MAASSRDGYPGAERFLPPRRTRPALARGAQACRGCPLHRGATQAVFGEGPRGAKLVRVGEQPGDREDREGHPFVGPAGQLLDRALEAAGIVRSETYVTNVVKHFKWKPAGKRRLHQRPDAREIRACRPWLEAELALLQPRVLVCLGATATQSLLGRKVRVTTDHGRALPTSLARHALVTAHPSSILREPDARERERKTGELIADLQAAAALLNAGETV